MESLESAKNEYETTKTSFRKLAEKYGRSHTHWRNVAKENCWTKFSDAALVGPVLTTPILAEAGVNKDIEQYELLSPMAVRKVEEILNYIGEELYSPTDEANIIMYATFYQRYLKLEKIVQDEGETIVSPSKGTRYFNPSYSALLSTTAQLQKLGEVLGLSIVTRKRNSLNFGTDENKEPTIFDVIKGIMNE